METPQENSLEHQIDNALVLKKWQEKNFTLADIALAFNKSRQTYISPDGTKYMYESATDYIKSLNRHNNSSNYNQ